ncbi:MAG TPA: hypothetical protein DDX12_00265 [Nitrospiraceae bacterium]|nr:hypothetical protein [Nitrospiraceae bacterium]HBU05327.1 hypothetical protein [Nitrospiraceae bacterium]
MINAMFLRNAVRFLIFVFAYLGMAALCHGAKTNPCEGHETSLLVDTKQHKMWLCQESKPVGEYKVAIGKGGINKIKQGDNKTPLGEYTLGIPRPSSRFGTFIPIGYPTQEQISRGYTGSDIGVHGPYRFFKWHGNSTAWPDWTRGCIAVGTDRAISEVARWIKTRKVARIIIR